MPSPFEGLQPWKPDAILELNQEARRAGPEAINATVGMIYGEDGKPLLFQSVRKAMEEVQQDRSTAYDPSLGVPAFRDDVRKMLYGNDPYVATAATIGGSEAVSFQLQLAKMLRPDARVILPNPPWLNHEHLCQTAGLGVEHVPYFENGQPTIRSMTEKIRESSGILLVQGPGHNPTGRDLPSSEWETLAETTAKQGTPVIFDIAYHGLGRMPEQDLEPLQILLKHGATVFTAWSASKNHSAYNLRVGHASVRTESKHDQELVESQYQRMLRGTHSSTPGEGQRIVARVQEAHAADWRKEIVAARQGIDEKRHLLQAHLPPQFGHSLDGWGLFAQLPLTPEQILRLRTEEKVFLTPDGRINIAGIPRARIGEFADKVRRVL